MLDLHKTRINLFKKHCLPLLTEKQASDWYEKRWETLSKSKRYQASLVCIQAELERLVEETFDQLDQLADRVKGELPEGSVFASEFYKIPLPGFYLTSEPRSYDPGKRNCVNCTIGHDGRYTVWGTDGYDVVLIAAGRTAEEAGGLAKSWLAETGKTLYQD